MVERYCVSENVPDVSLLDIRQHIAWDAVESKIYAREPPDRPHTSHEDPCPPKKLGPKRLFPISPLAFLSSFLGVLVLTSHHLSHPAHLGWLEGDASEESPDISCEGGQILLEVLLLLLHQQVDVAAHCSPNLPRKERVDIGGFLPSLWILTALGLVYLSQAPIPHMTVHAFVHRKNVIKYYGRVQCRAKCDFTYMGCKNSSHDTSVVLKWHA